MESWDLVSVSRPVFASLSHEGYRSWSQACLETLNTPMIRPSKSSVIQPCFVSCICRQGKPKQVRKVPESQKISEVVITFFWKFLEKFQQNLQIFKSQIFWWSLCLEGLGLGSCSFDYVTDKHTAHSSVSLQFALFWEFGLYFIVTWEKAI